MNTSFETGDHHQRQDANNDTITYHTVCIKRSEQMCDDDSVKCSRNFFLKYFTYEMTYISQFNYMCTSLTKVLHTRF